MNLKKSLHSLVLTSTSFILLLIFFLSATSAASASSSVPYAYITNYGSNDVSVIDTTTNTVISTVPVGINPTGVAVNKAGTKVYVANSGSHNISVIDTDTNKVISTLDVGANPKGIAINSAGTNVFITHSNSPDSISYIDTATNNVYSVPAQVYAGNPEGIATNPDGTKVYVTNDDGTVSIVNMTSTNSTEIPVGSLPVGIMVNPAGTKVYVANSGSNTVSVIDTDTNAVTATVPVDNAPQEVAINPTGTKAYVTNFGSNTVSVIDTDTNTLISTVSVGRAPVGVAISQDGAKVFVSNYANNTVSVIDIATNNVTNTLNVGKYPVAFGQFIAPPIPIEPILPIANFTSNMTEGYSPLSIQFNDFSNAISLNWDFGDGTSSTEKNPVHTFTAVGNYTVNLTASNSNGTNLKSTTISVLQRPPESLSNIATEESLHATVLSGVLTGFDFSSGSTPIYGISFSTGQILGDTLVTVDLLNGRSSLASEIPSGNIYKYFDIWVSSVSSSVPEDFSSATISFKVNKTWVMNNNINISSIVLNRYNDSVWTKLPTTLINQDADYLYYIASTPGFSPFAITGDSSISSVLPVANFNSNVTTGRTPFSVQFTDLSENATQWYWNFGDNFISLDQNPTHTYYTSGNYTVTLIVSNLDNSNRVAKNDYIIATKPERAIIEKSNQFITNETRITTSGTAFGPSIYGDRIVYRDFGNGHSDIYMYNLSTQNKTQITTSGTASDPAIYGDYIVWEDWRKGDGMPDIYMYNISSSQETQITSKGGQYYPVIYDDRVVWLDDHFGQGIYMFNITTSTESQIPTNISYNFNVRVYGDRIVWDDDTTIHVYNLTTSNQTQISLCGNARQPAVYEDLLVWQERCKVIWYIYMYNLSTQKLTQISINGSAFNPAIYGDKIVWVERSDDNINLDKNKICIYDLSTSMEAQITTNNSSKFGPAIYGDRIVWSDNRNGGWDIYMATVQKAVFPISNFTTNVTEGCAPLTVQFNDISQNATSWNWDFGDGAISTDQNPVHTYFAEGNYTVNLTVNNSAGSNTVAKNNYVIVSKPENNVIGGNAPLSVRFTDKSEGATAWKWNFGDGNTSTEQNPLHTYSKAGQYTVTLTISNSAGSNIVTKNSYVSVKNSLEVPVSAFSASTTLGKAPLNVSFTDMSTGSPTSWKWNFGDGNTSAEQNPMHTYSKIGQYTVSLAVSNAAGSNVVSKYGYISIANSLKAPVADFSASALP